MSEIETREGVDLDMLQEAAGNYAVDSREGITLLLDWARKSRLVLNGYHEDVAKRHDVSTDGVMFSRQMPLMRYASSRHPRTQGAIVTSA